MALGPLRGQQPRWGGRAAGHRWAAAARIRGLGRRSLCSPGVCARLGQAVPTARLTSRLISTRGCLSCTQ